MPEKSTSNGHVLITPKDCNCTKELRYLDDSASCPVCDWGLGICKICGAAEIELIDNHCPMKRDLGGEG